MVKLGLINQFSRLGVHQYYLLPQFLSLFRGMQGLTPNFSVKIHWPMGRPFFFLNKKNKHQDPATC